MSLKEVLGELRGGWPGSWKQYARGLNGKGTPFVPNQDPNDRRSQIPPLGLREYWWPALPASAIGAKKPVALKMLGQDLVFFRDQEGEVSALWDYCPHRGAALSAGQCHWRGFLSCSYHGATFDGNGECVEFITEGPDSAMVGRLKARPYPTRTLKDVVFVWMGQGEPVPIEEDVPPEMFEGDDMLILTTFQYWQCNWMLALENTLDAHNCWYVHRNAIRHLFSAHTKLGGGRPRTPLGYPSKVVNDRAVLATGGREVASYYEQAGTIPLQMYHPRVGGYWPLHRWRLLWAWFFELLGRFQPRRTLLEGSEEWQSGMHLPGMQRLPHLYSRYCVPVEANLTRMVYLRPRRVKSKLGRLWERITFRLFTEWLIHYNFSGQDYRAMRSIRWEYPEYLSATDSYVAAERRLIVENARGIRRSGETRESTEGEKLVVEANERLSVRREDDSGLVGESKVAGKQKAAPRVASPSRRGRSRPR